MLTRKPIHSGPPQKPLTRAELARVRTAMSRLPPNLREILILRGVEELSQAETAELLRISEKTVETRLYRARAKLRSLLGETSSHAKE